MLVVQLGTGTDLVHGDLGEQTAVIARATSPEDTLRRIDAVLACREAVDATVAPLLAVEALALTLRRRDGGPAPPCPMLGAAHHAALAQSVEHLTRNEVVVSSILTGGSTHPVRFLSDGSHTVHPAQPAAPLRAPPRAARPPRGAP